MNETNKMLAENLSNFLFGLSDEIIKGLSEYMRTKLAQEVI